MDGKKCICVVMSTYNGEKYLRTQIESILSQIDVQLYLYIRDDGSTDSTVDIIKEYMQNYSNIILKEGKNLGLNKSFWLAIKDAYAEVNCDFYAFADQDDFWENKKLIQAIDNFNGIDAVPALYYSNLKICDKNLNYHKDMYVQNTVKSTYKQALAQIFCWGCTCVFNRKAAELYIRQYENYPHDCWLFFICMFCGKTIYDEKSYIKYRRHGKNFGNSGKPLWGENFNYIRIFLYKLKSLKNKYPLFSNMCISMLNDYFFELKEDSKQYLEVVGRYRYIFKYKLKLLFTSFIATKGLIKNLSIKCYIVINRW